MYVLYVFDADVKFCVNQIFIIRSIHLFLCIIIYYKNLKFKHLIVNITNDFWFFKDFASMDDIKRKCNPIVVIDYNQVCSQILFKHKIK